MFFNYRAGVLFTVFAFLILCSCDSVSSHKEANADTTCKQPVVVDTVILVTDTSQTPSGLDTDEFVTHYIVIADSGQNYYQVRTKMFALNSTLHWSVDSLDRYYNTTKNEIVSRDTIDDPIYAGEYYPRRFETEFMSLEYCKWYYGNSTQKNIVLITGIYQQKSKADSQFFILHTYAKNAFVLKTKLYMGCMH